MTLHLPKGKGVRHRCSPPVLGGVGLLEAATPWIHGSAGGRIPNGTIWECECGKFFWAHEHAPILPGWDRVPAWFAKWRMNRG